MRAVWTESGKEHVPEGAELGRVFNFYAKHLNTRCLALMEKCSGMLGWQEKCNIASDKALF
jgi:hypothetical protein